MSTTTERITDLFRPPEHGVWAAGYTNTPLHGYQPFIDCRCDESFINSSWEDVGRQFDAHLQEVLSETK